MLTIQRRPWTFSISQSLQIGRQKNPFNATMDLVSFNSKTDRWRAKSQFSFSIYDMRTQLTKTFKLDISYSRNSFCCVRQTKSKMPTTLKQCSPLFITNQLRSHIHMGNKWRTHNSQAVSRLRQWQAWSTFVLLRICSGVAFVFFWSKARGLVVCGNDISHSAHKSHAGRSINTAGQSNDRKDDVRSLHTV